MLFKAVLTWLVFLLIGVAHVHVRDSLVAPQIGQNWALAIGFFVYSLVIVGIVVLFIFQNEIYDVSSHITLAVTWVVLSLGYKGLEWVLLWERPFFDIFKNAFSFSGLVFTLELLVMAASPWLANYYLEKFDIKEEP